MNDPRESIDKYLLGVTHLKEKLGMVFLQMPKKFRPKFMERIAAFGEDWPTGVLLAVELRDTDWYNDTLIADELYDILRNYKWTSILTDTVGRRDLLYMRLSSKTTFIRYTRTNHSSDYSRLDDWVERIAIWKEQGLENLYFFVHQNLEKQSPLLSAHFIECLNKKLDLAIKPPEGKEQAKLF